MSLPVTVDIGTILPPPAVLSYVNLEWVSIPAGWFLMGGNEGQEDERPLHRVWVDALEMARHQVTNREYALFLEATGRRPTRFWRQPEFSHPEQPVVGVTWDDAAAYCAWLGPAHRLPTEAEWERAARGGLESATYPWGNEAPATRPNYSSRWKTGPEPVATAEPNGFGLYDMCENVHEWCLDWYDPDFYARSEERNPLCRDARGRRASRGGSWRHHIKISRCSARSSIPSSFAYADYGFRVVKGGAHG